MHAPRMMAFQISKVYFEVFLYFEKSNREDWSQFQCRHFIPMLIRTPTAQDSYLVDLKFYTFHVQ